MKSNKEIIKQYYDIHNRATLRSKAISKINEMKQDKKSYKQIKEYIDKNFAGIITDKFLKMFFK